MVCVWGVKMIVIVDEREIVTEGYASGFKREGIASLGLVPQEFGDWVMSTPEVDLTAVEAFLLGDCHKREDYPKIIRSRCQITPVIALNETPSLEQTLDLFAAGVDDVVRKPVHVREILARAEAIRRRVGGALPDLRDIGRIRVYFDGKDPEVAGEPFQLPRRERRILEYLARNYGRRVTRSQIYNSVYGLLNEDVDETVVESHISKLRKKLKMRLGHDPIESKRYIGYMLKASPE